ncbi:MAG: hypothetical protein MUP66_04195 [Candidatus Nanohaloarchaeota archaeon QJJ-5]|nr:hypothetical protein [Candidatus Nanohaloarchaeota archaeon QJJ-5]
MELQDIVRERRKAGKTDSEIIEELVDDGEYTEQEVYDALDAVTLPSEDRVGTWFSHAWLLVYAGVVAVFIGVFLRPMSVYSIVQSIPGLVYAGIIVVGFALLSIWWGVMKLHDTVRSAGMAGAGLVFASAIIVPAFRAGTVFGAQPGDLFSLFQWASMVAIGLMLSLGVCVGVLYREPYGTAWLVIPLVAVMVIGGMFVYDMGRYPSFDTPDTEASSLLTFADIVDDTEQRYDVQQALPPFSAAAYAGEVLETAQMLRLALDDAVPRRQFFQPGTTCGAFSVGIGNNALRQPGTALASMLELADRYEADVTEAMTKDCLYAERSCSRDRDTAREELDQLLQPYRDVATHASSFFGPAMPVEHFAVFDCSSPAATHQLRIGDVSCDGNVRINVSSDRAPITSSVSMRVTTMDGQEVIGPSEGQNIAEFDALAGTQTITADADLQDGELYTINLRASHESISFQPQIVCRGGDGFCEDCQQRTERGLAVADLSCTRDGDRIQTTMTVVNEGLQADTVTERFDRTQHVVERVYRDGEQIETVSGSFESTETRSFSTENVVQRRALGPDEQIMLNRTFTGGPGTYRIEFDQYRSIIDDPTTRGDQYLLNRFEASCTVE